MWGAVGLTGSGQTLAKKRRLVLVNQDTLDW